MIGHYIDDNDLDALIVKTLVGNKTNLAITCSNSMDDLEQWVQPGQLDFILLDINRPDSVSIEKDLELIRKITEVPVVFITGNNADKYREAAMQAGAEAVIEKENLSIEVLHQILKNAVAQSNVTKKNLMEKSTIDPKFLMDEKPDSLYNIFTLALSYLDNDLQATKDVYLLSDQGQEQLENIRDTATSLKTYTQERVLSEVEPLIPSLLRKIQIDAFAFAAKRDVKMVFQLSKRCYLKLGDPLLAQMGIKHLLEGAILASRPGETVSFSGIQHEKSITLLISTERKIVTDIQYIFTKRCPIYFKQYKSMVSLNLSALMLGIVENDIKLVSQNSMQRMMITISKE